MSTVKFENGKVYCAECNQTVSKDETLKLNFCPKCGNPLNIDASVKQEKNINHQKIIMLYELLDTINDGNNAPKTIEQFIKELNENM